ncbi:NADH-quinone oxidoreductase subunit N [Streptomyces sp. NPDC096048]|uniref:NADH-quinone oxidoreductase subunit N n=1 Tax=Streptomyces sp. NPDC096048 TaxID=3366072 RepID=UPI00382C0B36
MSAVHKDPLALLPELLLLTGAVVTLLAGSFLPRHRQWLTRLPALAALAAAITAAAILAAGDTRAVYTRTYALDAATATARVVIPAAALLVLALATDRVRGTRRETEFSVLVLLASLGSVVLAGSSDLLVLAVGFLLASIPLYGLAGWARDPLGAEATLKLYLMGALSGITMLLGIAVLYATGGATTYHALADGLRDAPRAAVAVGLVALLAGLLFKAGAVPVHFWVPDATAGTTVPAAAFLTTVPKIGALIALYRVLTVIPGDRVDWRLLIAALAALSMTLGNFAAFSQTDPRRLLGYSTISQVGYLLMAVVVADRADALRGLLFYLAAYALTNLAAFAVLAAVPHLDTLRSYRGLGRHHPWLAAALVVCLLGLVGTPPTAVFVGKLTVFAVTWDGRFGWLVVIAAVNTLASLFYYLRWIAPAVATGPAPPAPEPWGRATALAAATGTLALGMAAGPVLSLLDGRLIR